MRRQSTAIEEGIAALVIAIGMVVAGFAFSSTAVAADTDTDGRGGMVAVPAGAFTMGSDDGPEDEADAAPTKEMLEKLENSVIAQRNVAKALFQMCANETMLFHFVTKGGIEAINRLVRDSADAEVSPVICPAVTRPPPLPVTAP